MFVEQFDLISFFSGVFLIIFYKKAGLVTAKFRERFLRSVPPKVKYSQKDIQLTQYLFLLAGCLITLISILEYFGIISFS